MSLGCSKPHEGKSLNLLPVRISLLFVVRVMMLRKGEERVRGKRTGPDIDVIKEEWDD